MGRVVAVPDRTDDPAGFESHCRRSLGVPLETIPAALELHRGNGVDTAPKPGEGVFAIPGMIHPTYIDSERIYAQHAITGPGDYEFDLQISSTEFGTGIQGLKVHIGKSWEDTRIDVAPKAPPRKKATTREETGER
jgi:hypothetical protein